MKQRPIELRKMTDKEYPKYMESQLKTYAHVRARAFKSTVREELSAAKKQVANLLKDGFKTKGHFMYNAVDAETGETVGNLWVHVEPDKKRAFLFDIIVDERLRNMGYGRAMLDSLETRMKQMRGKVPCVACIC